MATEDSEQVEVENADGSFAYVQPEVFDGQLVLAIQHENGTVERHDPASKRALRLCTQNPAVKALLDKAIAAAKSAGVKTPAEAALPNVDVLIEALKKAGLVVVPAAVPAPAAAEVTTAPAV